MRTILTKGLLCGMCFAMFPFPAWAVAEMDADGAGVTVETASGRLFHGEVDSRSDEATLWLRRNHDASAVLRPIGWDRVMSVQLADERYTAHEFLSALRKVRATLATMPRPDSSAAVVPSIRVPAPPLAATMPIEVAYRRAGSVAKPPSPIVPIQWMDIDVSVANWDGDVEADGVVVQVRPRDASGALVAVDGTLTVDLVGKVKNAVNRARDFVDLGRSVHQVRADDFGPSGASYRISFQADNPVSDIGLEPKGLVHARLTVPGQGVVDASNSTVQFRPYSSFREDLWQATGTRYWPLERTGAGGR